MSDSKRIKNTKRSPSHRKLLTDDELKLVEIVKKYPLLYSDSGYKNGLSLVAIWETVAMEFGAPPEFCRKQWINLRRCYKRYFLYGYNKPFPSKYSDGSLSFLDDSFKHLETRTKKKTKTEHETLKPQLPPSKAKRTKKTRGHEILVPDIHVTPETSTPCIDNFCTSSPAVELANNSSDANKKEMSNIKPQIPRQTLVNPNQLESTSKTTVLTKDIIGYLLKSKTEETSETDDLFESMASLVSEKKEAASLMHPTQGSLSTINFIPSNIASAGFPVQPNIHAETRIILQQSHLMYNPPTIGLIDANVSNKVPKFNTYSIEDNYEARKTNENETEGLLGEINFNAGNSKYEIITDDLTNEENEFMESEVNENNNKADLANEPEYIVEIKEEIMDEDNIDPLSSELVLEGWSDLKSEDNK